MQPEPAPEKPAEQSSGAPWGGSREELNSPRVTAESAADEPEEEMSPLERQFRALVMVEAIQQEFGPGLAVRNVHSRAGDDSVSVLD